MQIKSLDLDNYRNYKSLSLTFADGINIIYGENGQGKTNILESIYLCSFGKSHKGSKDRELIRTGEAEAHVKGVFEGMQGKMRTDIHLKKNQGKGIALNRLPLTKLSELYGNIYVVIFSAEDLDIVRRGPSERRRFMDMELCQIDPIYVENLISYNKILQQRRELFKALDGNPSQRASLSETLDIWDLQLVHYGSAVIKRRREYINELNGVIHGIHATLSGGAEDLQIRYEPSVTEEDFYEDLLRNREKDSIYKQTSVGPHRDDFSFFDKETDLKTYGSNGQQRTCALSLKLSEIRIIEERRKEKPVLLLDDVLSELDRKRQRQLLSNLGQTQTILTCTGIDEFIEKELGGEKRICIKDGQAEIKD